MTAKTRTSLPTSPRSSQRADRAVLFLFDCPDPESVRRALECIPGELDGRLDEVVVMDGWPAEQLGELQAVVGERKLEVLIHRSPRKHGYGGARKGAFEYALRKGFDHVICMSGAHPPGLLAPLLDRVQRDGCPAVFAPRSTRNVQPLRWLARSPIATLLNRILGLRMGDYHTGLRAFSTALLRRIPYQLDADDRLFDLHLLLQCRALGVAVAELPAHPPWDESATAGAGLRHAIRALGAAIGYRLHQLHLVRNGRYFVDEDVFYTFKRSRTGSHMQIVDAIAPGTRVLDLGCSQGLLARPLREKDVRLTGVDTRPPEGVAEELEAYFQRDLEQPLELPTGRVFDTVVCSDVIEHLRDRTELLRSARRYLKPGGRLIISTPNIALWFYRLSLLIGRFEYGPRGVLDETHVHLFTRASFRRLVEKSGFHIVDERVTSLPFEVVFESTGRSRLVRGLNRFYHGLARLWPEMFAYQNIFEAEITTLDEESTYS